jgi:hypothetical protein
MERYMNYFDQNVKGNYAHRSLGEHPPPTPENSHLFFGRSHVMRGLDPRIHAVPPALECEYRPWRSRVDGRVKPGHDDSGFEIRDV